MCKKLVCLLVVISFSLIGVAVLAQPKDVGRLDPAFKAKMDLAEPKLKAVESLVRKIESEKLITEKDSDDLHNAMYGYAEDMKTAADEALKDAEKAANTKGKEGNVANLKSFEERAKADEVRVKGVEKKVTDIEGAVKDGIIKLDRPILQKMTPSEREDFKKFLKPKGLKEMERQHPDIFKSGAKPGDNLDLFARAHVESALTGFCSSLPNQIGNFFVSPAEAAICWPCVAPCLARNWTACLTCIVSKGPVIIAEWNKFVRCWNGAGKPWWVPGWAWKTHCLVVFIGKVA
jgi:hypothetical protein